MRGDKTLRVSEFRSEFPQGHSYSANANEGEQELMSRSSLSWLIISLCTLFVCAEYGYRYAELPDKMASHFDAQGQPDGFMQKDRFVGFMAGMWVLLLMALALPMALVSRMPDSLLNLPHKEYWLAPERSESTRRLIGSCMSWISASTFLFMAYMFHRVLIANLPPHPPLIAWGALVIYLVFVLFLVGYLVLRFWRLPKDLPSLNKAAKVVDGQDSSSTPGSEFR